VENGSKWATQMHRFILDLHQTSLSATEIVTDRQSLEREFKFICQLADMEELPPKQGKRGKSKNSKGRNLLNPRFLMENLSFFGLAKFLRIWHKIHSKRRSAQHPRSS
jgi:hypothetical protein